jgi:hypothetical protein
MRPTPPKGHTHKLSGKRTDRVEKRRFQRVFRTLESGSSLIQSKLPTEGARVRQAVKALTVFASAISQVPRTEGTCIAIATGIAPVRIEASMTLLLAKP